MLEEANSFDLMRTIAGSILILAGAVLLQPAASNHHHLDTALPFAAPVLIVGFVLMIRGLKTNS